MTQSLFLRVPYQIPVRLSIKNIDAPTFSSIHPRQGGKAFKTDRVDAPQLAQFYASDLLTIVQAPELELEQDGDLLRSRQRLLHPQEQVRRDLQATLRRNGLHYKAETQHKSYWTKVLPSWLERTIAAQPGSLKANLDLQYRQLQDINRSLAEYPDQIPQGKIPNYLAGLRMTHRASQRLRIPSD